MIKGHDFIVFSDDWGRHPFSCQHIMKRFLPYNRVLWVNTIGLRNPRLTAYDINRCLEKICGWFMREEKKERIPEINLTVISPFMTPYQNVPMIREWNRRSVVKAVRSAMIDLCFHDPILVATLPNAADYAGEFNESAIVYYCVDDFTEWPNANHSLITDMENRLLSKADLVCASADRLCIKKARAKAKPFLLPHGVDFEHFSSAGNGSCDRFPGIARPLVGFFGAISPWLDFDLIVDLARSRPEWSFVFIGGADVDVSRMSAVPNIHLLGKVSYFDLPGYAVSFDVAIIPFLVNELTASVNPLKLMEYLACGLPVVSTGLPEVKKYEPVVYIADTVSEFGNAISNALRENTPELIEHRREVARGLSWDAVAETLSREIARITGAP